MKVVRNTKLFEELISNQDTWDTLFDWNGDIKDDRIPIFLGGLDYIEINPRGVYFYDIGFDGRKHSFVIRPEL